MLLVLFALSLLLVVLTAACGAVRPDPQLGPVIDASQNISVMTYSPLGRRIFIRHFHYFARPTQWTILSSGDSRPVTLFEQTAVYALRMIGTRFTVTRLGVIPGVRTDGVRPPRVHLGIGYSRPTNARRPEGWHGAMIVYLEDGPIYGGLDVGGDLDSGFHSDQPVRLLVDDRVQTATLAADGKTIAYINVNGQVFMTRSDGSAGTLLADVRTRFGPVSISAMQWEAIVDERTAEIQPESVLIRLNYGFGDQVWAVGRSVPLHQALSISPETVLNPDTDDQQLEALNRDTQGIGPDEWHVPGLQQFSP